MSKEIVARVVDTLLGQDVITTLPIPMIPIRDIETILVNNYGYNNLELDGGETNGWEIDFWYYFFCADKPSLRVSGSLHYGDFVIEKLSKEEIEQFHG